MKMIIFYAICVLANSFISLSWPKLQLQGVQRLDPAIRLSCRNPRHYRNRIPSLLQVPKMFKYHVEITSEQIEKLAIWIRAFRMGISVFFGCSFIPFSPPSRPWDRCWSNPACSRCPPSWPPCTTPWNKTCWRRSGSSALRRPGSRRLKWLYSPVPPNITLVSLMFL